MRIGLFTDSYLPYICGVTTSVCMLKDGLRALGHEVYVITTELTPKQRKEYQEEDPQVIRIPGVHLHGQTFDNFRIALFAHSKYNKYLKDLNLDIAHIHTEFTMGRLGLIYAEQTHCKVIYTSHTLWEDYFHYVSSFLDEYAHEQMLWGLKKLMNAFSKRASYTITPTTKSKEVMERYHLDAKYEVIPTGINTKRFAKESVDLKEALELRRSLGFKDTDYVFIYLGRVSQEKSIDVLLDAFLSLDDPNAKFMIVGDGPARVELEEKVNNSDKKDAVVFTGLVPFDHVPTYYQAGDCFINASTTETQGLTYVEALASGLPCVFKNDKVLEQLVENHVNAILYETKEELALYMNQLMTDDKLNLELAEAGVKSVEKYSKECYTNTVLKLYEETLKQ